MKKGKLVLLFCLLCCCTRAALAQSNEGTHFWFGFMQHHDVGENTMVVIITAKKNTSGVVRIPYHAWQQGFTVQANSVTIITLPSYVENLKSEQIDDNGIELQSEGPVSVYIHQYHQSRSEATLVLPISSLGHEYYMMSYTGVSQGAVYPSEFLLLGMEDSTNITITLSDQTKGGKAAGSTYSVQLQTGDTYLVQAKQGTGDLTGTYVVGDKKFNALSGAVWTSVPTVCSFRDNLLEQMYPVPTWGKQFVSAPFAHMAYDIFRIMASQDNTAVTVEGLGLPILYSLNRGEFIEYEASYPTKITANHPIAVAQYLIGSACSGYFIGDPSMILLNSVSQIRDTVTLYNSPFEAVQENYINLIIKTNDVSSTYFDGQLLANVNAQIQKVYADTNFTVATVPVQEGPHTIISQGCGVIASAYGYGNVESYAYGGGASFNRIDAESLIPEGACLNDSVFFFTDLKTPRFSFSWDLGDGTTSIKSSFYHHYQAVGTYLVKLYLTDNCLNTTDTLQRNVVITLRQAAKVENDPSVCVGQSIALGAQDIPGAQYVWTGPNQYLSLEQRPKLTSASLAMNGAYQVVGTVKGCESVPAIAQVVVHALPQPELGRDTFVCPLENQPLTILDPGLYMLYQWQDQTRTRTYTVLETGEYTVQVQDDNGCSGSDSVLVSTICPTKYYIPNIFSPNDDGYNDYFSVLGTDIRTLRLQVFDRWGNLLFEGNNAEARWDGRVRGRPVDPGVYTWVAQIGAYRQDGSTYEIVDRGSVTVIW
jgi:gliding motility-associated-like protein